MIHRSIADHVSTSFTPRHNALAPVIEQYAQDEGVIPSHWPGLIFGRSNQPVPRFPLLYTTSICVVAQGRKHVYVADDQIVYDPLHFLVVTIPLPLEAEIIFIK